MKLGCLFILCVTLVEGYELKGGYTCDPNENDRDQYCLCHPGEKVGQIKSTHNNYYEDRIYTLICEKIVPDFVISDTNNWYQSTPESSYDAELYWNGQSENSFMVGMKSQHSNYYEDRTFVFFTSKSDNWFLSGCRWIKINDYDQYMDYRVGAGEAIAGVNSYHSNYYEDREWHLNICTLEKKCAEIISIEYDYDNTRVFDEDVFAGRSVMDNTQGTSSSEQKVVISSSVRTTLAEDYTYTKSKGTDFGTSMAIKSGVTVGVPEISSATMEFTSTFSSAFSFSESWSRSETSEYSEENGRTIWYTSTCAPGCKCELTVTVSTAKGEIPYVMTSQSPGGEYTCKEEGTLSVDYSFDGSSTVKDQCI